MRALSATELLSAWERSVEQTPARRAMTLLGAACPDVPAESIARWSVGQRDARLLELRGLTFGTQFTGLAGCVKCGERIESTFEIEDLVGQLSRLPEGPLDRELGTVGGPGPLEVSAGGYEVRFRVPNAADLVALEGERDEGAAKSRLLARCVSQAEFNGNNIPTEALPAAVVDTVAMRMDEADPQADPQLTLTCPACGHSQEVPFDVGSFFWAELSAWAARILREVHLLASAYGWSEGEVLSLSPWRRQLYLELVGT